MSRRLRDALLGVALTAVTFGGVLWQVDQARGTQVGAKQESLPRLICPLH